MQARSFVRWASSTAQATPACVTCSYVMVSQIVPTVKTRLIVVSISVLCEIIQFLPHVVQSSEYLTHNTYTLWFQSQKTRIPWYRVPLATSPATTVPATTLGSGVITSTSVQTKKTNYSAVSSKCYIRFPLSLAWQPFLLPVTKYFLTLSRPQKVLR